MSTSHERLAGGKMRIIGTTAVVAAIAVVGGRVGAADLSGAEIKDMISGKTVCLECGQSSTGGAG
jgi:hypothetical protein